VDDRQTADAVWLQRRKRAEQTTERRRQKCMEQTADGEKHSITELNKIVLNQEAKDEAMEYLVNEEVIKVELNNIFLKK
jgi:hypothetical protein